MKISVVITQLNDLRISRTIDSLRKQTRMPDEIIIADGGSRTEVIEMEKNLESDIVKLEILPGSVAKTRNQVVKKVRGDVVAFIDTDEIAPEQWLEELTLPIERDEADFTGGPTVPFSEPRNIMEMHLQNIQKKIYRDTRKNITYLPMGNSAWKTEILRKLGFNEDLSYGGEDYDLNIRAIKSGYRGKFVESAFLYHDERITSFLKLMKKRYRYIYGAAKSYRINNDVSARKIMTSISFGDPLDLMELLIKAYIFLKVSIGSE